MAVFGIRVLGIPEEADEQQLIVHFSNPRRGGGNISRLHYPLLNNDAVIFFEETSGHDKLQSTDQIFQGHELDIRRLPCPVFSHVSVQLDQRINKLLDDNTSYLDNLQFDRDLTVTFDSNTMCYHMSGDWYQVEWAWAYLEKINERENRTAAGETVNGPNDKADVERRRLTSQINTRAAPHSSHAATKTAVEEKYKILKENTDPHGTDPDRGADYENFNEKHNTSGNHVGFHSFHAAEHVGQPRMSDCKAENYSSHNMGNTSLSPDGGFGGFSLDNITRGLYRPTETTEDIDDHFTVSASYGENAEVDYDSCPTIPKFDDLPPQMGLSISKSDFQGVPLTFETFVGAVKVTVMLGDLIQQDTDAIVSPASSDLANRYGVAAALSRAAGKGLQKECKTVVEKNGTLFIGDVIHTCAGGMLDKHVGFILHAVGPTWRESFADQTAHLLTCTFLNCFQYANNQLWLKSLSLPLISTGLYGVPLDVCVQAFYDAIQLHVSDDRNSRHLIAVNLLSNDQDSACASIVVIRSLMETTDEEARKSAHDRYVTRSVKYEFMARDFFLNSEIRNRNGDVAALQSGSAKDTDLNISPKSVKGETKVEKERDVHPATPDIQDVEDKAKPERGNSLNTADGYSFSADGRNYNLSEDDENGNDV